MRRIMLSSLRVIIVARQKRIKSETGIYHIMLRGINKQQVFFDDEDYIQFLHILSKVKTLNGFKLHSYCLMSNHIHLLIQEGNEPLELIFKRLGDRFIYWYNLKYKRTGPVFQGRYKSVPVNDDEYFISVMKYIHQNPVKAGIVESCGEYKYSSYNEYYKWASFVDTAFAMELIGENEFERIHNEPCAEQHLDIQENEAIRISDTEAKRLFEEHTHCMSADEFQKYPKDMQRAYVNLLRAENLSERQICRLTDVTRWFIRS